MEPIALIPWFEHLERHVAIARDGNDPEGVHQVRVAAGHLIVWLDLAGLRVLRDDLAWLRGGAGRLRELDVLLGTQPPEPWRPCLEERRAAQRRAFVDVLDGPRLRGLLQALPLLPPLAPGRGAERLGALVRRARKRGEHVEGEPADIGGYHRLRKALRRVRYAKEWLGEDTSTLRALQTSLGEMNDASVALGLLSEWPERESLPDYRAELLTQLERARRKSAKRWKRCPLRDEVPA